MGANINTLVSILFLLFATLPSEHFALRFVNQVQPKIQTKNIIQQFPLKSNQAEDLLNISKIHNQSTSIEKNINNIEKRVDQLHTELDQALTEIANYQISPSEAPTELNQIDIAEKEIVDGIEYDKDIFDHAQELAQEPEQIFLN